MSCRLLVAALRGILVFSSCLLGCLAQRPWDDAIAAGERGDHARAAALWLTAAETAAATTGDAPAATLVEYLVERAFDQHRRAATMTAFDARLAALRQSPLATTWPILADRIGGVLLAWRTATAHAGTAALAQELGFLTQFWICGPFANERGAGFAQELPPQRGFDPDATWPGKQRPVTWRLLPPAGVGARFPLGQVLTPSAQSLAYCAVALHNDAGPQAAVLELGSTDSWRVFCNGAEVAAREVERPFAYDQDAVPLVLATGWNLLVLKLCHQDGAEFQFAARLRAPAGGALRGVTADPGREAMLAAATTAPVPSAAGAPNAADSRSVTTADGAGAADLAHAAWCRFLRSCDGDADRVDRSLAERALQLAADDRDVRLLLARSRVRRQAHAADRDENARRHDYEAILAADPQHVPALVELGQLLLQETGLRHDAAQLARRALAVQPDHVGATLLLADVQTADGLAALATTTLTAAAAATTATPQPQLLRRAATARRDANDPEGHLQLRRRICDRTGNLEDRLALADLLLDLGDRQAGVALLQAAVAAEPFVPRPRRQLAELAVAENRLDEALQLWRDWLAIAPDDADALVAVSRVHGLRAAEGDAGARQAQIEALRAALECNPNLRQERRYLEFLADRDVPFYRDFQLDGAAVIAADRGPPADAGQARDALHWLLRQDVIAAHRNGTTSHYVHAIVRVLRIEGARRLAGWSLPWYRGEQRARMLACTVRKADGSVQRPPLRGAGVALETLQPGDVVELQGRVDDLAPSFFGDYFGLEHHFAADDGSPVARSELVVLAAPGRDYRVRAANGAPPASSATLADGTQVLRFALQDLPRDLPEPYRPLPREHQPIVQISTMRDWDHFASWWWNLIRNQLEVTPAMRQKLAELTAGATTTAAKVAAVYRFVSTDVRYEAWEFGVHGYKPYATSVIFDRRHGDCKDKALLLCALLGELGIPCHPVLIFADDRRSTDDLTLAMVQQFNHCIAWLPPHDGEPGRFLDGTATWHPIDTLPTMDQGARVLIVDQGRAELRDVAMTTPAANTEHQEFTVDLRPDGTAALQLRRAPTGNRAVELRAELATEPARARQHQERQLAGTFGKVTLQDLVASDPTQLGVPVTLTLTGELPQVGNLEAARWELPSTFGADSGQQLATEPERRQPLLLGVPNRDHRLLRYRLPAGFHVRELPAAQSRTTAFASFRIDWRRSGDRIEIERTVDYIAPRIASADWAEFRAFVAALADADGQRVVLHREEAR